MTTTIKITELTNIGANLASTTVFPVVNMAGTPTTQKTVLGNIANVILAGAGNAYVAVGAATVAATVTTNAQPNITSMGNLTGLTVSNASGTVNFSNTANVTLGAVGNLRITGGTAGQLLSTNGNGTLSWASDTTTYGNSNVVTLLSAFGSNTITTTGNISGGNLVTGGEVVASGNVSSGTGFTTGGFLSVNGTADLHDTTVTGYANITGTANVVGGGATVGVRSILAIDSAFGSNSSADPASAQAVRGRVTGANLTKTRNYVTGVTGQYLITGTNASEFIKAGVLGVVGDQTTTADGAVVAYLDGDGGLTTANAAYAVSMKNSTPNSGFNYGLDLQFISLNLGGVTTSTFKQADIRFNNGVKLVANTAGNISINGNVTVGNIIATNIGNIANINLTGNASNVLYGNGVFASIPAGANTANVTFNNVTVQGVNGLNLSAGADFTANLAYLQVRSGDVASHIHLDTGNNTAYDLIVGDDDKFVQVSSTGDIIMSSYDSANTTSYVWTFDTTGNLTLPDTTNVLANVSITLEANDTGNITGLSVIGDSHANLYAHGNVTIVSDSSNTTPTWTFDTTGNLTLPLGSIVYETNIPDGALSGSAIALKPIGGTTANQQLLIYPTAADGDHIHMTSGNLYATELFLGSDNFYVKLANTGNIVLNANDSTGNTAMWTFGTDGDLILAGGNSVIQSIANSSSEPLYPNVSTMVFTPDALLSSQSLVLDPTGPSHIHLRAPGANIDEPDANIFLGGEDSSFEVGYYNGAAPNLFVHSGGNTWTFGTDGNLTTPSNLVIGPGTGSGSRIFQYDEGLEIVGEGANSVVQLGWTANTSAPDSVATIAMNYPSGGEGNILIAVGNNATTVNYWLFDNTGNLTLPGNTFAVNYANGTAVSLGGNVQSNIANGNSNVNIATANGNVVITSNGTNTWNFDTTGNLIVPGSSGGFIKTVANASIGVAAVDNGTNNPAQLISMTNAGAATSIVSAYATNATIQTNATGTLNTWQFDNTGNLTAPGTVSATTFTGNGGGLSNVATKVAGSWTLASGNNTVNISVPLNGTYSIWVNGNIPNGIITYTATAVVTNTNVPVLGSQYAWYYSVGNALVFTTIPDQFTGTVGSISNVNTYLGNTANVFTFGITNNSGNTAVVNYGYTKL